MIHELIIDAGGHQEGPTFATTDGARSLDETHLLTVFRKSRSAETAEVHRAVEAQRTCKAIHDLAHDIYEREGKSR